MSVPVSVSQGQKRVFVCPSKIVPERDKNAISVFVRDRDKNVYINIHCLLSLTGQGGKEVVRKLSHDSFLPLPLTKGKFKTKARKG